MAETLYLIDGHFMIYRAYYAPFRALTSPAGEPTRATYVFSQQLLTFIAKRKPAYLAMAVDGPVARLRRRALSAEYKLTRKPMPADLPVQVDRILQIVQAMGIAILRSEGHEADDVLATVVEKFARDDLNAVIISRDKDLDQVVGPHVVLYDPMKDETFDAAAIEAAKGYPPDKAVEVQTLCGDTSDNIAGIPGVGPKTAARLVMQYGSADGVVAHADELTPKLKETVLQYASRLPLARSLVTLDRHVPLEVKLADLKFIGPGDRVRPLLAELGFNRLLEQLDRMGAGPTPAKTPPPKEAIERQDDAFDSRHPLFAGQQRAPVRPAAPAAGATPVRREPVEPAIRETPPAGEGAEPAAMTSARDFQYTCIDTPEKLDDLVRRISGASVRRLAVDTETTGTDPMQCQLVGISLAWEAGKAVYLPVKGPMGAAVLDVGLVRQKLGLILADAAVEKLGHNIKYDLIVLEQAGFEVAGAIADTMIAAHVLDSTRSSYKLDALAGEFLHHTCIPIADLIGRGKKQTTIDTVPIDTVTVYSGEDADLTFRLAALLQRRLAEEGLTELFARLEMPLTRVLVGMERRGIIVDLPTLKELETALSRQADDLREKIILACGVAINPDSPRQLAEVLFERFKLPVLRRTPTGPSTDSAVLEELAAFHELPAMVLDYRKLTKLLGTYLVALRQCVNPTTGRVHTSFHQTATVTGRLSSSDPNLQNIPIRTDLGRQIRAAFRADAGWKLISADYSQVELRVLAHFCQDPKLIDAFHRDQDIHRIVAAEVFAVPVEAVTAEQRARAKTVNFGIIYGQTAFGLAKVLRIARGEAGEFIQAYRQRFPKIDEFLRWCIAEARRDGYVQTIFGRRRRIVGLDSPNGGDRAAAERLAINSVVQGSAADLIKQAMIHIDARIRRENRPCRMLLQIHDELLFETPRAAAEGDRDMIRAEMSNAIQLRVPLKVDVGIGDNWMQAH